MRFLSVCSGIEAASVAWNPLGWKAWGFSEIEPFPSAVLAHHYPDTPNLGDMTKFKDWPDATLDVLCGGTPCQSFSNAGLRAGLDDPRGQLMLTFGAIAARYRPRWLVWENVPGVLSSNGGRDFGAFLGLLGFLGYGFAYRVLDAQFVRVDGHGRAVPQRRNRVFVVGCLGDWRSAAAVLLERESLRGDPAPRREARARIAAGSTGCAAVSSGHGWWDESDVGATLRAQDSINKADTLVAGALAGTGPGAGWRIGPDEAAANHLVAGTLLANGKAAGSATRQDAEQGLLVAHTLRGEGFDASEDGTGRGVPLIPFDTTQITSAANRSNPGPGDPCHPLAAGAHAPSVAYSTKLHNTKSNQAGKVYEGYTVGLDHNSPPPALLTSTAVRRLMPVECERLMGFEPGYTAVPWRGRPASECPDGPRYKALGNSWATNCARWVGRRIALVDGLKP